MVDAGTLSWIPDMLRRMGYTVIEPKE